MTAIDKLREGDLAQTYAALTAEVRKNPADAKLRVFLFQLLCIRGEWDRALTQLKVCGELDAGTLAMVQAYREAIACEMLRKKVFAGELAPLVFGKPEKWVVLMIEALKPLAAGQAARAAELRAEAFEAAPMISGTADGVGFDWIADADMRLGPILEIIVNGRYYWAPFAAISKLILEEPADLRDRVWTPVHVTWANGGEMVGFVPTRYPGSESSDSDAIRLSAQTTWTDAGADTFVGHGQRLLSTNEADLPLMDLREIILNVQAPEAAGDADGEAEAAGDGEN
jgi:type VI secretion system protein ImpE